MAAEHVRLPVIVDLPLVCYTAAENVVFLGH